VSPAIVLQLSSSQQRRFKIAQTLRRQLRLLAFLIYASFALPYPAVAQTSAPAATAAPLPPEAQDALKKGIIAAQQQDYLQAIRFFQDARKIAPDASEIYFDLGLAESKIPGRELRAICWFEAYLAANPNAPNAAAVRVQIHTLDVNNTSNFSRLVKAMQDATNQLVNRGTEYDLNLGLVAVFWEEAGDMTAALKTADSIRNADYKNQALASIAITSAGAGDIPGAQEVADLIEPPHSKDGAIHSIAVAQARVGDITAALKTANLIQDATEKQQALTSIVESQAKAGDFDGAERNANLILEPDGKADALKCLAQAQAEIGDFKAALGTADLISDPADKSEALSSIAAAQKQEGRIKDADATFALALRTAHSIRNQDTKAWEQRGIADAQEQAAKNPASEWLEMLDDSNPNWVSDCALNTSPFLDVAGFLLKAIAPNEDPLIVLSEFQAQITVLEKAQDIIHLKMKQQAGK
jgi:tetratricopeptide (TPR) repeat protein